MHVLQGEAAGEGSQGLGGVPVGAGVLRDAGALLPDCRPRARIR